MIHLSTFSAVVKKSYEQNDDYKDLSGIMKEVLAAGKPVLLYFGDKDFVRYLSNVLIFLIMILENDTRKLDSTHYPHFRQPIK